jgi:uncharacterized membrane protein YcaP (DUF421 family)
MHWLIQLFGESKDLSALQMSLRGVVVFIVALILIRISGRRSFGMHMPLDNIISILLGAVLSRAVVGASPFLPIMLSGLAIVLMHRLFTWLTAHNETFGKWVEGTKIDLYKEGGFRKTNMQKGLVSEEDILQGVRKSALTEDMNRIEKVYIERNGEITAVKKST